MRLSDNSALKGENSSRMHFTMAWAEISPSSDFHNARLQSSTEDSLSASYFHSFCPYLFFPPKNGTKENESLTMTKCFLASGKVPVSSESIPVGWGKMEEFADWVFVAGMFSFPLPRFSWLDQSTNRRKGAHISWPCHPKWLWHFQECSSRSSSSFLAAFTLSHKRFLQQ